MENSTNYEISESTQRCDGKVKHIMFSDGGQKLVTCSTNGTLLQWDATNGKQIEMPMKQRLDHVVSIVMMTEKCGIILAVCTDFNENNQVIWWNTSTCEMIVEPILLTHASSFRRAAVSSNGEMIVTGSPDGTVQ